MAASIVTLAPPTTTTKACLVPPPTTTPRPFHHHLHHQHAANAATQCVPPQQLPGCVSTPLPPSAQAPPRLQAHVRRMMALQPSTSPTSQLYHPTHPASRADYRSQPSAAGFGGKADNEILSLCSRPLPESAPSAPARRGWRKRAFITRKLPWSALHDRAEMRGSSRSKIPSTTQPQQLSLSESLASANLPLLERECSPVGGRVVTTAFSNLSTNTVRSKALLPERRLRCRDGGPAPSFAARELPWSVLGYPLLSSQTRTHGALPYD